jgi:hypothetical protein
VIAAILIWIAMSAADADSHRRPPDWAPLKFDDARISDPCVERWECLSYKIAADANQCINTSDGLPCPPGPGHPGFPCDDKVWCLDPSCSEPGVCAYLRVPYLETVPCTIEPDLIDGSRGVMMLSFKGGPRFDGFTFILYRPVYSTAPGCPVLGEERNGWDFRLDPVRVVHWWCWFDFTQSWCG